ncbi:NUDIX hydrolase [Chloroflexota bacterium]
MKQSITEALSRMERQAITANYLTPAAVLLPLYEKAGEYYILFTKRTQNVEHHKGHVSFPGGKYDTEDGDLLATALRETFEEIGVCPSDVDVLGTLDMQNTTSSNFTIAPFVGIIPYPYQFSINREEVDKLFGVPLSALLTSGCQVEETDDPRYTNQPHYVYYYRDQVIWGATARILKQFLEVVFG